jgi:hypothetical protein
MQLTEKLQRHRKLLIVLAVVIVALLVWVFLRGREPGEANTVSKSTLALASPEDSFVYRSVEGFVLALVADEREQVLAMLTDDHRMNWMENSYLYGEDMRQKYESIRVGDLRHSIVRYVQVPEAGNATMALVTVRYVVEFVNNGEVETSVMMEEKLGLRQAGELWKIAVDERRRVEE